ncbi:hypothetical protein LIER_15603 [Lithospermum erythrorhizon]|uniref:Uncharacterized protein n=1 Tax=Lithospermum erythrorhizon TaxID=34254 RepID=A0AAV3Q4J3_LITER
MKENGSPNLNKPFLHDNSRSHRKLKSEDEQLEATNFATIDGSPNKRRCKKQRISQNSEIEESVDKFCMLILFDIFNIVWILYLFKSPLVSSAC